MAEDAGKKDEIRRFLRRVNYGTEFIEDIWIEREVKQPGSEGKFNEAKSVSGRPISNISELLNDDLRYSLDDGGFVFRFVAALPGSGKTTLLGYLRELIEVEPRYRKYAIVVEFPFVEVLSESGNTGFGVKFYSCVLTRTFWELMRDDNTRLPKNIKAIGEKSLSRIVGEEKVAQLRLKTDSEMDFTEQLNEFFSEKKTNFQRRFFDTVKYFLQTEPQVTFVYLIDELDGLKKAENLYDALSVIRDLINEAYSGDIRLMFYMVGVADHVDNLIKSDQALYSRISNSVISLVGYRQEECEQIRAKIEGIIKAAYSGCKDFDQAWTEIQNIQLKPASDYQNLRAFCQQFSGKVIEIHEKYFQSFDQSFNKYESKARQLTEAQARIKWSVYLGDGSLTEETNAVEQSQGYKGHTNWKKYKGKNGFVLLVAKTTTIIKGIKDHAIDCYAELWHNGHPVAKAYGEAKNYPLTKEHIDTFHRWLTEFNYEPFSLDGNPPDLAFIISPSATDLQKRKLKIRGIEFIESGKIEDPPRPNPGATSNGIGINQSSETILKTTLKADRFQNKTIEKFITSRPYKNMNDLVSKTGFGAAIQKKLQVKINRGEIYFD